MEPLKVYIERGQSLPADKREEIAIIFEVEAKALSGRRYLASFAVKHGDSWSMVEAKKRCAETTVVKAATEDKGA